MRSEHSRVPFVRDRVARWKLSGESLEQAKGHIKALLGSAVILAAGFGLVFVMKVTIL